MGRDPMSLWRQLDKIDRPDTPPSSTRFSDRRRPIARLAEENKLMKIEWTLIMSKMMMEGDP